MKLRPHPPRPALPARVALAAFLPAAAALLAFPAPASSQDAVWSATLTVGRPASGSDALDYCQGAANCSAAAAHYGSLIEPGFSIGETDHAVTSIRWGAGGEGHVHLTLDRRLSAAATCSWTAPSPGTRSGSWGG